MRPGLPDLIRFANYVAVPLRVPESGKPIQAFVCVFKTSKNALGPLVVDQHVVRPSGVVVGNDLSAAFWDCDDWPCRVYEIVVEPGDVFVGQGEMLLKTRAFRVVRDVPLEEIFGLRAGDLGTILGDMRRVPWLAPPEPLDLEAARALVESFYSIAAEHAKVRPRPVKIVEQWEAACDADLRAASAGSPGSVSALTNAARVVQVLPAINEEQRFFPTRALRRTLIRQSYPRMWEAGWQAANAAFLRTSMKQVRPGDAKAAKRMWAKLRDKITAKRESMRRAAIEAALRMLKASMKTVDDDSDEDTSPPVVTHFGSDPVVDDMLRTAGLNDVSQDAWNFAVSAITTAVDVMETAAASAEHSPSQPLLELFRMGLWPIGEVDEAFVIYAPAPTGPAR